MLRHRAREKLSSLERDHEAALPYLYDVGISPNLFSVPLMVLVREVFKNATRTAALTINY